MTELRIEPYELPAAPLGEENPLPVFRGQQDDSSFSVTASVPPEDRQYLGWRTEFRVLPYRMQDGYSRNRQVRRFVSLVLENERLRAVVLPEVGGKLVSLTDKASGRELLHRNPVFQPANLALRNAWTSGGVEWNAGQTGHHYLTCSPVFAARVTGAGREPILRIYEWERIKGFTWQVDFHLPDDSPFLFAHVRLVNPHPYEIPIYWWTNIAVEETPDVRVLAPADTALHHAREGLTLMTLPTWENRDVTYAAKSPQASDCFFRIPGDTRRWITALDRDGRGLIHTSTDRLRGRKLFCWGMTTGGRRWQEFLGEPGRAYLEIQAGLARTQYESLPMPPETAWGWSEAFGLLEADPKRVHGPDWLAACQSVETALEVLLPRAAVERLDGAFSAASSRPRDELLCRGSGWGALERRRLETAGETPPWLTGPLVFDDASLTPDQQPWLHLLEQGVLPERDPEEGPGQFIIQEEWERLLKDALAAGRGDHWLSWCHLGVMKLERRDVEGAWNAFERSNRCLPNAWALRNLAIIEERAGYRDQASARMLEAWHTGPQRIHLGIECAQMLLDVKRYDDLNAFLRGLPEPCRASERMDLIAAKAALCQGRYQEAAHVFQREPSVTREGETTLTDLWFTYQEQRLAAETRCPIDDALRRRVRAEYPPPRLIDFRMTDEAF